MGNNFSSTAAEAANVQENAQEKPQGRKVAKEAGNKPSIGSAFSSVIRLAACLSIAFAVAACSPEATVPELLDRATSAMERGDVRAADIDVRTALQQTPDDARARSLLGEIYLLQLNPVAAVAEFERALGVSEANQTRVLYARALLQAGSGERLLELAALNEFASVEDNPRYLATLARAQAGAGDLADARGSLDAAMAVGGDDPYVATTRALFLWSDAGMLEAAETTLQEVLASNPEYDDAWRLLGDIQQANRELAEAESSYARAAELNPYQLSDRLNLVTVRLDQGKTSEADTLLQRLLASSPDHPGVNFLHGRMLVESGDNEEAIAAFRRVFGVLPDHPGSLYFAALANMAEGNLATARDNLDRLLAVMPGNTEGSLLLANLHLLMDDPESAGEVARSVLEVDSTNYSAMQLLATALGAQGQSGADNIDLYQRMADARPDAVEPRLALGAALAQEDDVTGARTQFQRALELDPDNLAASGSLAALASAGDDAAQARALYMEALAGRDDLASRLELARLMLQEGLVPEAEQLLEEAENEYPDDPGLLLFLSEVRLVSGDLESAAAYGDQLLDLLPGDATALAVVARIELRSGEPNEAEQHLRQALAAQPDSADLRKMLAEAQMLQGKLQEADAMLAELPEDEATQPAVLVARARIALTEGRPEEAEPLLRSVLEQGPDSRVVMLLSSAIKAQGRNDEALSLLDNWLTEYPGDSLVRYQLAEDQLLAGREQQATELYQILLDAVPDNAVVLNNLAWLLRNDDPQQALDLIERADSLVPDNAQILDTYAMIRLELGATEEALALNQRALDGAPGNPDLLYNRAMILQVDGQREEAIRILADLVDSAEGERREEAQTLLTELRGL